MVSAAYFKKCLAYSCLAGSFLIISLSTVGCDNSESVNGSVFVVTKGNESYKLSLVNVSVYKRDIFDEKISGMESVLSKRNESFNSRIENLTRSVLDSLTEDYMELQTASLEAVPHSIQEENTFRELKEIKRQRMGEVLNQVSHLREKYHTLQVQSILKRPPEPYRSVKTDADGEFSLTLETGEKYVFCATSQRKITGSTEYYAWTHEVEIDNGGQNSVMLSNDNLISDADSTSEWDKYSLISSNIDGISGTIYEDIARSLLEEDIFP